MKIVMTNGAGEPLIAWDVEDPPSYATEIEVEVRLPEGKLITEMPQGFRDPLDPPPWGMPLPEPKVSLSKPVDF